MKLESLLKESNNEKEDEDNEDVYTDEQLNEVIARDEKEYDLFQEMDKERYASEDRQERIKLIKQNKVTKAHLPDEKINYRLI